MKIVMKLEGLVLGMPTAFDGQYLVDYDPSRDGTDPLTGLPMSAWLVTSPDIDDAMRFDDMGAFHDCWTAVDPRDPVRRDGRPNRPLTAFTVSTEKVDDQSEGSNDA